MKPDDTWVGYRMRTSTCPRKSSRKMGLPLLTENIASKIWTAMTWAVYDGDVPILLALRSILEWRTTAWWRNRASWGMAWDSSNVQRWKHKFGFHNRGVQWDTPMASWAGEGNNSIKLMAQFEPRKEDVIRSLLESMKQTAEKKAEPNGTRPTKKPRDLSPLVLGIPEAGKWPTLEIKGDCKTIVDWVNGHAKMKTKVAIVAATQNLLREWWGRGIRLRKRKNCRLGHTCLS